MRGPAATRVADYFIIQSHTAFELGGTRKVSRAHSELLHQLCHHLNGTSGGKMLVFPSQWPGGDILFLT